MEHIFSENFDFERSILTDAEEMDDVLKIFNYRETLGEKMDNKILINVTGQIVFDLKDKLNPTYDIKLNAI